MRIAGVVLPLALAIAAGSAIASPPTAQIVEDGTTLDVVYWPTPAAVVDAMIDVADVKPTDLVYDLGCGDGRIVVAAAKRGARGIGFDLNPKRVREARRNAERNRVQQLVEIRRADIFKVDFRQADVVFMYLLPEVITDLKPALARLKPGARIVSHEFGMRGAKADRIVRVAAPADKSPLDKRRRETETHKILLWRLPWKEQIEAT